MYNTDTFRTIVSFDTSSLSGQTVSSASFTICRQHMVGSISAISVDVKAGTFGNYGHLSEFQYSASATLTNAFSVNVPASDSACTSVSLPSNVLQVTN